jgi:hypothetical protein
MRTSKKRMLRCCKGKIRKVMMARGHIIEGTSLTTTTKKERTRLAIVSKIVKKKSSLHLLTTRPMMKRKGKIMKKRSKKGNGVGEEITEGSNSFIL